MPTFPYTPNQVQRTASVAGGAESADRSVSGTPCAQSLDVTKRDRFELLSAYIDSEVTPEERQQVLCWLEHDANARCLYNRLLLLRQGMRSQACPPACDAETTIANVFCSLNRRLRMAAMATVGVAAVGAINLLSGGAAPGYSPWQTASEVRPEALQIALDRPAFPIPETAVSGGIPVDSEL
jgi:anti-sigma factor RsiW